MEPPYNLTYISALDQDFNVVWSLNENLDEEEADYVVQQGVKGL